MNTHKRKCVKRCRRKHKGGSARTKILAFLRKVNNKLKSSKVISRMGSAYGKTGLPYSTAVSIVSGVAGKMGYGRHRRRHQSAKGLKLAGGSLRLAGGLMGTRRRI